MPRLTLRSATTVALLFAALATGGAVAVRHAQRMAVDRALTEVARALAPWGALTWDRSWSAFDGRMGARGLEFKAAEFALTADALELDPGGPWAALRFAWRPSEPPVALGVRFTGVRYARSADPARDAAAWTFDVAPCGDADGFAVLAALTGDRPAADVELRWRWDADARRLDAEMAAALAGLVDARLELEVEPLDAVASLRALAAARPVARRGALTVTERGWYARSAAWCAAASGVGEDAWRDANLAAAVARFAAEGLAPSDALVAGWRGFRADPGSWRIGFDNPALHGLDALAARDPAEVPALIGLEVAFNGAPVADPGVTAAGALRLAAVDPLGDAPLAVDDRLLDAGVRSLLAPVPASPPAAAAPQRPTRADAPLASATVLRPRATPPPNGRVVAWDGLRAARGTEVWVVMRDGRTLTGVLKEATPWRLTLEQRLRGGSALMPLDREKVGRVIVAP